jgi:predicted DNA-binding transcriptional regulator AlpA
MKLLRYFDLEERHIATSRAQLKNLIEKYGFPPGFMLSPNARAWPEAEVDRWLESRPVTGPLLRGAALARQGRPREIAARKSSKAEVA